MDPTIPKHRNNSSGGFTPRNNRPPAQTYRPNYSNNHGGPPKPGGNNNNNNNHNSHNNNGNNTNTNTGPRTGSNAIPITPKDKSTINCYECGVVGHYSKECPKKLAKIAANPTAPAQQQRRFANRRNQNNNNGRFYHMTATEAQALTTASSPSSSPESCREYWGTKCMRPSDPITPWTQQLHPEHLLAVAYTTRILACPFDRRRGHAVDAPLQHLTATLAGYK
ncbi:hypothetical protein QYE76_054710 [Lolium multiflorum]|uniref:CCHC-type domain-containing protein n=1 Tax=Lolium multiflorum TaxID=4521 RepID=A0AAD8WLL7_LOLMU|nr:hypothetical protein QYE76_054710 [Lolium multiflorum]